MLHMSNRRINGRQDRYFNTTAVKAPPVRQHTRMTDGRLLAPGPKSTARSTARKCRVDRPGGVVSVEAVMDAAAAWTTEDAAEVVEEDNSAPSGVEEGPAAELMDLMSEGNSFTAYHHLRPDVQSFNSNEPIPAVLERETDRGVEFLRATVKIPLTVSSTVTPRPTKAKWSMDGAMPSLPPALGQNPYGPPPSQRHMTFEKSARGRDLSVPPPLAGTNISPVHSRPLDTGASIAPNLMTDAIYSIPRPTDRLGKFSKSKIKQHEWRDYGVLTTKTPAQMSSDETEYYRPDELTDEIMELGASALQDAMGFAPPASIK